MKRPGLGANDAIDLEDEWTVDLFVALKFPTTGDDHLPSVASGVDQAPFPHALAMKLGFDGVQRFRKDCVQQGMRGLPDAFFRFPPVDPLGALVPKLNRAVLTTEHDAIIIVG